MHKEKFVSAWADQHLHLGSKNTSRVEGANSVIKHYLASSLSDLHVVRDRVELAIKNQKEELVSLEALEKNRIQHFHNRPLYRNLLGKITHFAFKNIEESYQKFRRSNEDALFSPAQACK
jgi:hypothetical protein